MIRGIDATLCISLHRRPDRWQKFADHAAGMRLDFDLFPAVDGLREPAFIGLPEKFKGFEGALGCAWSHWRVAQMMIANRWNRVLVLEDDARFCAPLNVVQQYLDAAFAANAFQIHLGLGGSMMEAEVLGRGPVFWKVAKILNTHAYVMTLALALELDAAMRAEPIRSNHLIHVDRLIRELSDGRLVTAPFAELVAQDKSVESDVQWSFPDKTA